MTFTFISGDGHGQPSAGEKARIRSHCMRGRNRRADSRRSLREARQLKAQDDNSLRHRSNSPSNTSAAGVPTQTNLGALAVNEPEQRDRRRSTTEQDLSPLACPHDMALIRFAGKLDDHSYGVLHKSEQSWHAILGWW